MKAKQDFARNALATRSRLDMTEKDPYRICVVRRPVIEDGGSIMALTDKELKKMVRIYGREFPELG